MDIVVLCCGNLLASDDGFGMYVLEELEKMEMPENVTLVDAGSGGLDILTFLENADKAIIVDAVFSGDKVGNVHRFVYDKNTKFPTLQFSLHEMELMNVLKAGYAVMSGSMPDDIIIIGVEIERTEQFSIGLTPSVQNALPVVMKMILKELNP